MPIDFPHVHGLRMYTIHALSAAKFTSIPHHSSREIDDFTSMMLLHVSNFVRCKARYQTSNIARVGLTIMSIGDYVNTLKERLLKNEFDTGIVWKQHDSADIWGDDVLLLSKKVSRLSGVG